MYLEGILRITAVPLREKRTVKTDFHAFYPYEHNFSLCCNKLLIVLKISFIYTVVIKPYMLYFMNHLYHIIVFSKLTSIRQSELAFHIVHSRLEKLL